MDVSLMGFFYQNIAVQRIARYLGAAAVGALDVDRAEDADREGGD
jgi:hypothetical protein